jgi:hypothetical protein
MWFWFRTGLDHRTSQLYFKKVQWHRELTEDNWRRGTRGSELCLSHGRDIALIVSTLQYLESSERFSARVFQRAVSVMPLREKPGKYIKQIHQANTSSASNRATNGEPPKRGETNAWNGSILTGTCNDQIRYIHTTTISGNENLSKWDIASNI